MFITFRFFENYFFESYLIKTLYQNVTKLYQSYTNEQKKETFPIEILNKINDASLPQHRLFLKLNQPIMLLRNIAQK